MCKINYTNALNWVVIADAAKIPVMELSVCGLEMKKSKLVDAQACTGTLSSVMATLYCMYIVKNETLQSTSLEFHYTFCMLKKYFNLNISKNCKILIDCLV